MDNSQDISDKSPSPVPQSPVTIDPEFEANLKAYKEKLTTEKNSDLANLNTTTFDYTHVHVSNPAQLKSKVGNINYTELRIQRGVYNETTTGFISHGRLLYDCIKEENGIKIPIVLTCRKGLVYSKPEGYDNVEPTPQMAITFKMSNPDEAKIVYDLETIYQQCCRYIASISTTTKIGNLSNVSEEVIRSTMKKLVYFPINESTKQEERNAPYTTVYFPIRTGSVLPTKFINVVGKEIKLQSMIEKPCKIIATICFERIVQVQQFVMKYYLDSVVFLEDLETENISKSVRESALNFSDEDIQKYASASEKLISNTKTMSSIVGTEVSSSLLGGNVPPMIKPGAPHMDKIPSAINTPQFTTPTFQQPQQYAPPMQSQNYISPMQQQFNPMQHQQQYTPPLQQQYNQMQQHYSASPMQQQYPSTMSVIENAPSRI